MSTVKWKIRGEEKEKYENIFDSLGPQSGKLSGDKVKPVLLNSTLPFDTLGQVWELADIDKDGCLDKDEFSIAMHLVYRALEKEPVPQVLPTDLIPPSKRKPLLPGAVAVLPIIAKVPIVPSANKNPKPTPQATGTLTHALKSIDLGASTTLKSIVPDVEYKRFSSIFSQKVGTDSFIAGTIARDIFVQSGLPQASLAHIWNLCDQQKLGKLTQDQFIVAMHLISQKVKGVDISDQLCSQLLPKIRDSGLGDSGNTSDSSSGVGDFSAVRELDALNREIEDLRHDKETLSTEIHEKELHVRSKSSEVQDLQNTLDRTSTSLAQLEAEKAESHTRLDELDQQQLKLDSMLADIRSKVKEENMMIISVQSEIKAQEMAISQREEEFNRTKNELENLKKEGTQLQQTYEISQQQLQSINRQIEEVKTEIEKVRKDIKSMVDQQGVVSSNIVQYDKAVAALKSETEAASTFEFDSGVPLESSFPPNNGILEDPFKKSDPFLPDTVFTEKDVFETSDPFSEKHDPFSDNKPFESSAFPSDPFAGADPFSSVSNALGNVSGNGKNSETEKSTDMFSASFFEQDDSFSLFPDIDQRNKTAKEPSDDPWAAFSTTTPDNSTSCQDLFGNDSFVPNPSADNTASSIAPTKKAVSSTKKDIKNMSEEAQLAWAEEESKQAEEQRKEKLRIQEQMDLEYAIKLSKQL